MKFSIVKNNLNTIKILLLFTLISGISSVGHTSVCGDFINKIVNKIKYSRVLDKPYQELLSTMPDAHMLIDTNSKVFEIYKREFEKTVSLTDIWKKVGKEEHHEIGTIFEDVASELSDQVIVAILKISNTEVKIIKGKVLFVKSPDMKIFNVSIITKDGLVKVAKKDLSNIHILKEEKWIEKHSKITKNQRLIFSLTEYYREGMDHKFKFFFKLRDPSETPELISVDNKFLNYIGQSGFVSKSQYDPSFFNWLKHPIYSTFMLPQKIYWDNHNRAMALLGKKSLQRISNDYIVPTFFNGLMETLWRRRIDGGVRALNKYTTINYSTKTLDMLKSGAITSTMPLALVAGIGSFGFAYNTFDKIYDEDILQTKLETIHGHAKHYIQMIFSDPLFLRVRQKYLPNADRYSDELFDSLPIETTQKISEEVYVRLTATDDYYYGVKSKSRKNSIEDALDFLRKNNTDYKKLKSKSERKRLESYITKIVTAHLFLEDMSASVLFPATKQIFNEKGPISKSEDNGHGIQVDKKYEGKLASDEQLISLMDFNNKQLLLRPLMIEMGGKTSSDLPIMLTSKPELLVLFNELLDNDYIQFLIKKAKVQNTISMERLKYLLLEYASWEEKFSRWNLFEVKRYYIKDGKKIYLTMKDFIKERKKSLNIDNDFMLKLNTLDFFDTLKFDNTYLAKIPHKDMLGYQAGRLIGPIGRQVVKFRSIINFATRNRMKAGARGAGTQQIKITRDAQSKKLKAIAVTNTFFGEIMNKLGTVLVGIDLWARCDGKQDILDLNKTTGRNPYIRMQDNTIENGVYNYVRSAAFCLNAKSLLGMDERKMGPKIKIKQIDDVTRSLMKFMFIQNVGPTKSYENEK